MKRYVVSDSGAARAASMTAGCVAPVEGPLGGQLCWSSDHPDQRVQTPRGRARWGAAESARARSESRRGPEQTPRTPRTNTANTANTANRTAVGRGLSGEGPCAEGYPEWGNTKAALAHPSTRLNMLVTSWSMEPEPRSGVRPLHLAGFKSGVAAGRVAPV